MRIRSAIGAISVLLLPPLAFAQSLAEVAQREEARRKAVKHPAKVYTNADLRGGAYLVAQQPPPAAPSASPPAEAPLGGEPGQVKPNEPSADPGPAKDEAYWRARIAQARMDVDRTQTYLEALQSRVYALTTDFVNRDDPAQRAVIAADRNKALAELNRLTTEVQAQTKAITDIEEEARHAGVPPGWLR